MLKINDVAPDISLLDQDGKIHSLSDYNGNKLLVYFYPRADTPGCTRQSCAVSEAKLQFAELNVSAVGISPDVPESQKKFDDKFELGFPLLSDPDHKVATAYGVWVERNMYGKKYMGIKRSSFLIDENGKLEAIWYNVKPEATVPNVLKTLGS